MPKSLSIQTQPVGDSKLQRFASLQFQLCFLGSSSIDLDVISLRFSPSSVSSNCAILLRLQIESVLTTSMSKQRGLLTKVSEFLERLCLLNPRVRMNFAAFPLERTRKEPRSSVRFWAATGV